MSSGALFSNNSVRGASKNLVEFKAGKMTMKGKMVYPDTRKGLLYVYQSDDALMHFCWKDRTSGVVEDDLIIFPEDCEFKHVPQCKTGRIYLLRFKLSSKKFFFWLQDLKTEKDDEHCRKINEVLNNPPTPGSHQRNGGPNPDGDLQNLLNNMSQQQLMQIFGGVGQIGLGSLLGTMRDRPHNTRATTTTVSTPVTTSATRPPASQTPAPTTVTETPRSSSGTPKNSGTKALTSTTTERSPSLVSDPPLYDLERRIWNMSTPPGAEPAVQRGVVTELTNSIPTAITATECLEQTMNKHLPPGDSLSATLSSPQFSQALSMFWSALQSGQAGPIVRQFGMGPDAEMAVAAANLEDFVVALENERVLRDSNQPSTQANVQQQSDDEKKSSKDTSSSVGEHSSSVTDKKDKKNDKDDEMALD